ncbi:MAG: thioredoxin domain-containing protein [Alphaproteobacteria bacterium]|nr:thioredoxin domain-containing protein [Alphaproteobacteria bacterium]
MTANVLGRETSPYLLQHKDDPVHWRPWGEEAFAAARAQNKPILLSVGYAACHWCHVMAHESFESEAVAALMNAHFVNIKVDREERPDVDAVYQAALQAMGEQGGWPLTMFLEPGGRPFWGGTYFPPESRWNRPGFPDVLKAMDRIWREEPGKIAHNAAALKETLEGLGRPEGGGVLSMETVDRVANLTLGLVDMERGGTRGAPKFPQVPLFRFLWRAHLRNGGVPLRNAVLTTLDNICQGGIYDHLGGGFARYSTDEEWLVPHFEKMLYDNAQLVELLSEVWCKTQSPLYAARVGETVAWMLSDMTTGGEGRAGESPRALNKDAGESPRALNDAGESPRALNKDAFGLASAYDADSEGEEGKYYVWSEAQVDALLGAGAAAFKKTYDVTAGGNWEHKNILRRDPRAGLSGDEPALAAQRETLLAARKKRIPPQCDDKVLADWNGMAAAALAAAGAAFDEPAWIEAAKNIFAFVQTRMTGADGRLSHSWREGRARHPATVEDLAQMARAALALHQATGEERFLAAAEKLAEAAARHYWDDAQGGYFLSAADTTDVFQRTKPVMDNATPAGNGAMAEVLARLYHLTGRDEYRARAEALLQALVPARAEAQIAVPGLLCAFEYLERPVHIVVASEGEGAAMLARAAHALAAPAKIVQCVTDGTRLPPSHPAHGKGPVNGRAAAYVCIGRTCGLPVTEPAELARSS